MTLDTEAMMDRVVRLASGLPGVEQAPYFGGRALKVGGKAFAYECRYPGVLAVYCAVEMKPVLIEASPELYFDTDHFSRWPAILVRMEAIDEETLANRLEAAWRDRAPKRLLKELLA